jgi:hypothetical protein
VNPTIGDLLFYKATDNFIDKLIVARTGGPWVHVAIVVTAGNVIEAVSGGVRSHAINPAYGAIGQVGDMLYKANQLRFITALVKLQGTVGQHYGFGDILDQFLMLLPGQPCISWDRSEDCSHLAVEFLLAAGYGLPFGTEGARISPTTLFNLMTGNTVLV